MLTLEHVAVRYSGRPVLRDVSFSIAPGEIVAYLGANGAGKPTTMKVVTGLREPDHGRVPYAGRDVAEDPLGLRRRLGYVPETAEVLSVPVRPGVPAALGPGCASSPRRRSRSGSTSRSRGSTCPRSWW